MSNYTLKIIAISAMIIDHFAAVFVSPEKYFEIYIAMRVIGRIAFPLFCFLLIEGYMNTKNIGKYMARMAAFAVISEIPFDLTFFSDKMNGSFFYMDYQNVFFTLLLGLITIRLIDWCYMESNITKKSDATSVSKGERLLFAFIVMFITIVMCCIANKIHSDYGSKGILIIVGLFLVRNDRMAQSIMGSAILLLTTVVDVIEEEIGFKNIKLGSISQSFQYSKETLNDAYIYYSERLSCTLVQARVLIWVQLFAIIGMIIILMYNGKLGKKPAHKYTFYAIYPIHLLVFYFVSRCI